MVFQFFYQQVEVVQVVACPQVDALVALRKEWMQGLQLRKTAGFDFLNLQLSRLIRLIRRYQNYIKLPMGYPYVSYVQHPCLERLKPKRL